MKLVLGIGGRESCALGSLTQLTVGCEDLVGDDCSIVAMVLSRDDGLYQVW